MGMLFDVIAAYLQEAMAMGNGEPFCRIDRTSVPKRRIDGI